MIIDLSFKPDMLAQGFSSLLENMHLVVISMDMGGNIRYVNKYFLDVTGYTEDEIIGKNWFFNLLQPEHRDSAWAIFNETIAKHPATFNENPILRKDGTLVDIEWSNTFIKNKRGSVIGTLSIGADVSKFKRVTALLRASETKTKFHLKKMQEQNKFLEDTKKAMLNLLEDSRKLEEELQEEKKSVEAQVQQRTYELEEEKAKLLSAINSVPDGFIVADTDSSIVLANSNLAKILGTDDRYWTLKKLQTSLNGSFDAQSHYEKCLREQKASFFDDIAFGSKVLRIYVAPIYMNPESPDPTGAIFLVSDVTEEKVLARSKDEFFSIASHELRTPLTAIRGNAEMLRKTYSSDIKDPEFAGMVADIFDSSVRLIDIVNEFLTTSRLEQGKIEFVKEKFNIVKLVENVSKEMQNNAQEKGLYLNMSFDEHLMGNVYADSDRVKEVLINLISNAIKFTEKGGVEIRVVNDGDYAKILVSDTGRGIPLHNQPLLFRKFQQATNNIYARDSTRSTGLGLYISKLMVEAMHGKIELEQSSEGVGSTFSFTIPFAR